MPGIEKGRRDACLRGLLKGIREHRAAAPFDAVKENVSRFFEGYEVVPAVLRGAEDRVGTIEPVEGIGYERYREIRRVGPCHRDLFIGGEESGEGIAHPLAEESPLLPEYPEPLRDKRPHLFFRSAGGVRGKDLDA